MKERYSIPGTRRQTCQVLSIDFFDEVDRVNVRTYRARDSETGIDAGGASPIEAFEVLLRYVQRKRAIDARL